MITTILCSGGGLRGVNEVTTLEALTGVGRGAVLAPGAKRSWDTLRFSGCSIGALLVLAASDGPEGVAKIRPLFAGLRKMADMFSIPMDLTDGLYKDGFVSMVRAKKLLKAHGVGKVCKYPAWVAITYGTSGETELVALNDLTWDERLDAAFVSGSQSPIMEIVKWRGQVAYDGGLEGMVCPAIPEPALAEMRAAQAKGQGAEWHEIWAAPPGMAERSAPRTESEVDDAFGLLGVQLDRQVARVCSADLTRSNTYRAAGFTGYRYSPRTMVEAGPTFGPMNPKSFRERIHRGLTEVGDRALRERLVIP